MDLLHVTCVFLIGLVSTCNGKISNHGSSIFFTDEDPVRHVPLCRYQNKPCMIMVRTFHRNGSTRGEYRSSNMCRCPGGNTCPSTWDGDPGRTITRYLRTLGNPMTLQLKFCQQVQRERICEPHEVALTLKGNSIVPQEVTSVNCSCANNEPLYKQKVWNEWTAYGVRNENYVCNMPSCGSGNAPCLLYYRGPTRRETTYLCQCRGNMQCRRNLRYPTAVEHAFGVCREPQPLR